MSENIFLSRVGSMIASESFRGTRNSSHLNEVRFASDNSIKSLPLTPNDLNVIIKKTRNKKRKQNKKP